MRIAHISDLHIGYRAGKLIDPVSKVNLREQDGYDALRECVSQIVSHGGIDVVVCTGDFFHSPFPSVRSVVESLRELRRLSNAGIPFYCLAGNHDATDAVRDVPSNALLHVPEVGLFSYTAPYRVVELDGGVFLHLVSHHGYNAQKETMELVRPVDGGFNILCTHGSCFDDNLGLILHSDAEPREVVIPESVLGLGWDYVLLGHIHERGWVGSRDGVSDTAGRRVFYGGSFIRRGFSDKECRLGRGWTEWVVEDGCMSPVFHTLPQRAQFDFLIECDGCSVLEIESGIERVLSGVDVEVNPIVRVCLSGVSEQVKSQVNWRRFDGVSSKCLSFVVKVLTKDEAASLRLSGEVFSFSLLDAFKEFWGEFRESVDVKNRALVGRVSGKLLKKGQDVVLEGSK